MGIESLIATLTDQRGCAHTYHYDGLGRPIHDCVTTLGSGVDGAIRRLSTTFEARGLPLTLSSYDNASVTSGTLVNQVRFAYNAFSQLVSDSQSHGGPVIASSTPQVSLSYADGSGNTIRPTALTYPDGRVLSYDYGTADGINDAVSRVGSLIDDDLEESPLVEYSYLGLTSPVIVNYPEPDVKYTLASLTGTNDPDTGDLYSGVDRFGRVKDARWYSSSSTADVARLQYGYDRASNRTWRADLVAQSLGKDFDELYGYDGLQRLQEMQRGELSSGHTSISSQNFAQCWRLDSTSNWQEFKEAASGTTLTLAQERHSNTVNEITSITRTVGPFWATPSYDAAGNTTTIPKPDNPAAVYGGTYDAWNRLVKLNIPGTSETVQEHQYDARNFRTVRKNYSSGTLSETRHFYYTPGWQVLEERLGTTPDSAAPDRHFVWGLRYIDDLVLRERDTDLDGRLDERLYSLQDANWNVVALINPSGAAEERYQYTPFGTPIILTGSMSAVRSSSAVGMEVLFTGQRFEELTKLHLFRMRWFDSLTGRFINRDPLGYPDGMNAYAGWFVLGGVDPNGTDDVRGIQGMRDQRTSIVLESEGAELLGSLWGSLSRTTLDTLAAPYYMYYYPHEWADSWQETFTSPIRDKLIGQAQFQGDFTPEHNFELDQLRNMVGARAIEGWYGTSLCGTELEGDMFSGGERTQALLFGVADFCNAGAAGVSAASAVPRLGSAMYPQPLPATSLEAMAKQYNLKTLGTPNTTYPAIYASGWKELPLAKQPPGYVHSSPRGPVQYGYPFPKHLFDNGAPGAYYASHVEPKIDCSQMRISKMPCKESCQIYLQQRAIQTGRPVLVEYPNGLMIFNSNGTMSNTIGGGLGPVHYGTFAPPFTHLSRSTK